MRDRFAKPCIVMVVAALAGATASVSAAAGGTVTRSFTLPIVSCPATGQLCAPVKSLAVLRSRSTIKLTYSAGPSHCSNVQLRLFVDGRRAATTPFTSPRGTTSVVVPWPKDGKAHKLGYEAKGQTGGCNSGVLVSWDGTITLTYQPRR